MDSHGTRPPVLARIPEVNSSATSHYEKKPPVSYGRFVSQAFAFKLLAGCVVLLVAGAIVPVVFRSGTPPDATPSADATSAWPAAAPTAAPETAHVTAIPESPIAPPVMPSSYTSQVASKAPAAPATPATDDDTWMTPWPGPKQTTSPPVDSQAGETRSGANQSMANRPPEYRNSHDSTRPGIH